MTTLDQSACYCVYCETVIPAMPGLLLRYVMMGHIESCEKHPLALVRKELGAMRQLRKEEGARLRRMVVSLENKIGVHDAEELSELADGLECGNPLGDCGCEGMCFTRGDE